MREREQNGPVDFVIPETSPVCHALVALDGARAAALEVVDLLDAHSLDSLLNEIDCAIEELIERHCASKAEAERVIGCCMGNQGS